MTDDWKKLIFENEHETLFETDNIYESMNYYTIHFAGYNLMIKK